MQHKSCINKQKEINSEKRIISKEFSDHSQLTISLLYRLCYRKNVDITEEQINIFKPHIPNIDSMLNDNIQDFSDVIDNEESETILRYLKSIETVSEFYSIKIDSAFIE